MYYAFMAQELVPNNTLPDDFTRALKYSDYSSVSLIFLTWNFCHTCIACFYLDPIFVVLQTNTGNYKD
jgi:hypothetical protein